MPNKSAKQRKQKRIKNPEKKEYNVGGKLIEI